MLHAGCPTSVLFAGPVSPRLITATPLMGTLPHADRHLVVLRSTGAMRQPTLPPPHPVHPTRVRLLHVISTVSKTTKKAVAAKKAVKLVAGPKAMGQGLCLQHAGCQHFHGLLADVSCLSPSAS